jgi:REP element-mobilizing transposase RayT
MKSALVDIIHDITRQDGMEISTVDVQPDQPQLCETFPPSLSIAVAVKLLKGISPRRLRVLFAGRKRSTQSDRLWAPSY